MDLPLWLTVPLVTRSFVDIDLPGCFGPTYDFLVYVLFDRTRCLFLSCSWLQIAPTLFQRRTRIHHITTPNRYKANLLAAPHVVDIASKVRSLHPALTFLLRLPPLDSHRMTAATRATTQVLLINPCTNDVWTEFLLLRARCKACAHRNGGRHQGYALACPLRAVSGMYASLILFLSRFVFGVLNPPCRSLTPSVFPTVIQGNHQASARQRPVHTITGFA